MIQAPEARPVSGEIHIELVALDTERLEAVAPDFPAFLVAEETETAPMVTRGVGAPTGDVDVPPARVAASGRGDHEVHMPVAEKQGLRCSRMGCLEIARGRRDVGGKHSRGGPLAKGNLVKRRRHRDALVK